MVAEARGAKVFAIEMPWLANVVEVLTTWLIALARAVQNHSPHVRNAFQRALCESRLVNLPTWLAPNASHSDICAGGFEFTPICTSRLREFTQPLCGKLQGKLQKTLV